MFRRSFLEALGVLGGASAMGQSGGHSTPYQTAVKAGRNHHAGAGYTLTPDTHAQNPVFDRTQVPKSDFDSCASIDFVADPFYYWGADGLFHGYAEIAWTRSDGITFESIGHWTSPDAKQWAYDAPAIDNGSHKAYPFVWRDAAGAWMTPGNDDGNFQIWHGSGSDWAKVAEPLQPENMGDPTPIRYLPERDAWGDWNLPRFILLADRNYGNGGISVYVSKPAYSIREVTSKSDWREHSQSPIWTGLGGTKLAGRPLLGNGYLDVPIKPSGLRNSLRFRRVHTLTSDSIEAVDHAARDGQLVPTHNPRDWRYRAAHHIDIQPAGPDGQAVALVDFTAGPDHRAAGGNPKRGDWCVGVFTAGGDVLERARAHVSPDADRAVPGDGSWTRVDYDGADAETMRLMGGNPRYHPMYGGRYWAQASVSFVGHREEEVPFYSEIALRTNGPQPEVVDDAAIVGTEKAGPSVSGVLRLDPGDQVSAEVRQTSGVDLNLASGNARCTFDLIRLASL